MKYADVIELRRINAEKIASVIRNIPEGSVKQKQYKDCDITTLVREAAATRLVMQEMSLLYSSADENDKKILDEMISDKERHLNNLSIAIFGGLELDRLEEREERIKNTIALFSSEDKRKYNLEKEIEFLKSM